MTLSVPPRVHFCPPLPKKRGQQKSRNQNAYMQANDYLLWDTSCTFNTNFGKGKRTVSRG
eukprot:scaffold158670_cov24-Prasinocladus_malaysianus.AAC.1